MKKIKKFAVCLVLGITAASLAVGCRKKPKETESVSEQITESLTEKATEVEEKTGTAMTQTKLYTSRDKTFSISLPDSSWKNTKDTEEALVFESEEGSITIAHLSGSDVSAVKLPATGEEVLSNFTAAGKDAEQYEIIEFKKSTAGSVDQYHTVIKCTDPNEDYSYSIGYDLATDTEIYSVTGLVKDDNESVMKSIKTAVESFKLLKKSTAGAGSTGNDSSDGSADSSPSGNTKVIYDSSGNPITVTKGTDGVWKDSSGKSYDMQQYGVMGSDGYWYTYQAPSGGGTNTGNNDDNNSNNNSNSNNNTNNGDNNNNNNANSSETGGFYDRDGNYISVTKDSNGNWVDSYGTVYYFGDSGVTDNAGNYYPYQDSSESTGFYDNNGNYITVTKDANGNWVDTSGAKYTFGDTGVTDEAGNFYPY